MVSVEETVEGWELVEGSVAAVEGMLTISCLDSAGCMDSSHGKGSCPSAVAEI